MEFNYDEAGPILSLQTFELNEEIDPEDCRSSLSCVSLISH